MEELTPSELRKDYYEHTACIKHEDSLITRDEAITIALRYQIEGRDEEADALIAQINEVKEKAKKLFPDK